MKYKKELLFTVNADQLNLRKGAGTDFGTNGDKLKKGTVLTPTGKVKKGWAQVITSDMRIGWVSAKYIKPKY